MGLLLVTVMSFGFSILCVEVTAATGAYCAILTFFTRAAQRYFRPLMCSVVGSTFYDANIKLMEKDYLLQQDFSYSAEYTSKCKENVSFSIEKKKTETNISDFGNCACVKLFDLNDISFSPLFLIAFSLCQSLVQN